MEGSDASIYWTGDICPENADKHIALAKKGGFTRMLVYYPAVFDETVLPRDFISFININAKERYEQLFDTTAKECYNGVTEMLKEETK